MKNLTPVNEFTSPVKSIIDGDELNQAILEELMQILANRTEFNKLAAAVHAALTNPHSATASNVGSRLVLRDANGDFSTRVITAALSGNATSATSAGNADTVDGQHFSWANSHNNPTYLWGADSNGNGFLASRAAMVVGSATNATNHINAFAHYLTYNGYFKTPQGFMIQWGSTSSGTTYFPTAFPSACLAVVATQTNGGNYPPHTHTITGKAPSYFTWTAADAGKVLDFIAIGV